MITEQDTIKTIYSCGCVEVTPKNKRLYISQPDIKETDYKCNACYHWNRKQKPFIK